MLSLSLPLRDESAAQSDRSDIVAASASTTMAPGRFLAADLRTNLGAAVDTISKAASTKSLC